MCLYDVFANLGAGWVNGATVISAAFGIIFSIFAFFFSIRFARKLSGSTDKQLQESARVAEAIRSIAQASHRQTASVHRSTKILRLDNLRYLYEISRGTDFHNYWHFRWRFETYDQVSVTVTSQDDKIVYGDCRLLIQGYSNDANHLGFERRASEFYISKVSSAKASSDQTFPFADGDLIASYSVNGTQLMISKGTDVYTTELQYKMTIGGLGQAQMHSGIPTADNAKIYPRIKDV